MKYIHYSRWHSWLRHRRHAVKKIIAGVGILCSILVATNSDAVGKWPYNIFGDGIYDKKLSHLEPKKFTGIEQWLNTSKPIDIKSLRGKVVLINFWTFSCYNCRATLPALVDWDKKFRSKGLVIIGIHSPEFESDKRISSIQKAIARHGITYPVPVDNQLQTWDNYRNSCWPAFYFINKYGKVVRALCGEHNYSATEHYLAQLLSE
ncbi:MAG: redoxin domain-containing protein [Alphaproteobacteria bacterium]